MKEVILGPLIAFLMLEKEVPLNWLLLGFLVFGIGDLLITYEIAQGKPYLEGNPIVRPFLMFPFGLIIGSFLWTYLWIWLFIKLKPLRGLIGLGLLLGHYYGVVSWYNYWNFEFVLMWVKAIFLFFVFALEKRFIPRLFVMVFYYL